MKTYTKQEIFDISSTHLLQQNQKALDENNFCEYRTKDGLKCAIGCLIDDDVYNEKIEGVGVQSLNENDLGFEMHEDYADFLQDLQCIHDNCLVSDWADELKTFSDYHNLEWKHEN